MEPPLTATPPTLLEPEPTLIVPEEEMLPPFSATPPTLLEPAPTLIVPVEEILPPLRATLPMLLLPLALIDVPLALFTVNAMFAALPLITSPGAWLEAMVTTGLVAKVLLEMNDATCPVPLLVTFNRLPAE